MVTVSPGSLTSHVALVTGSTSGIGKATAVALARSGATLCLVGRNLDTLASVAESLPTHRTNIHCYQADLSLDADLENLCRQLRRDFDALDMLIHSAGVFVRGTIDDIPATDFDSLYRVNVRAPYVLTQALLPLLRVRHGYIVFMNSTAGIWARAQVSQYAATKHALKALADSVRDEVHADGIRVLSVFIGRTATPMQAAVHKSEGKPYCPEQLLNAEDIAEVITNTFSLANTVEITDLHIQPIRKSAKPSAKETVQ